ncbi:hypothetical protein PRABACTJOHN_03338 [Parabacteroides johnsonii DSM 18315]|uniref:Uncharacterized protein n=1 Tax=Parabacteroides johnsonii DSM 18315 TaxID=537006 RepID=B7BE61_9BACT|nr:hypothetical protein PRABACTJOHN_03338 [Parabacteroides johnsonii DSM 18315]
MIVNLYKGEGTSENCLHPQHFAFIFLIRAESGIISLNLFVFDLLLKVKAL